VIGKRFVRPLSARGRRSLLSINVRSRQERLSSKCSLLRINALNNFAHAPRFSFGGMADCILALFT
jgi:hypothetical protein